MPNLLVGFSHGTDEKGAQLIPSSPLAMARSWISPRVHSGRITVVFEQGDQVVGALPTVEEGNIFSLSLIRIEVPLSLVPKDLEVEGPQGDFVKVQVSLVKELRGSLHEHDTDSPVAMQHRKTISKGEHSR